MCAPECSESYRFWRVFESSLLLKGDSEEKKSENLSEILHIHFACNLNLVKKGKR